MAKKRNFRNTPNMLVTGTPGTGKTTFSGMLAEAVGFRHINVGDWVKERQLHTGWDDEHQCLTLDEDKVCDAMEPQMAEGGNVVDFHSCDFFPERWFDLVVVLQTDNTILYGRLEARGYPQAKISENVQCEIMNVVVEEARSSYREEIVWFLSSNSPEDISANIAKVRDWIHNFDGQTG